MASALELSLSTTDPYSGLPPPSRTVTARRSFSGLRSITALVLREMSTRYGRTPGGYIWAVLEPMGALIVMAVVFSILLRAPSLGNSFILFYASGYLPFTIYASVAGSVQTALMFSKPLLMYPAVSWIDAILARFILNFLTGVVVLIIVLIGILHFTAATATLSIGPIILSVILAALLGLGIGTLNCLLAGLFSAWGALWGIATRPLFLVAGVIFLYEDMPASIQGLLWYTPWIHFTGLARTGIYPTYAPDYISVPLVLVWAMVPLALGLVLLRRHHQDILNR